MNKPLELLKQYWKHDTFRPLQAEIIDAVLSGHDAVAILPTGGGKSVCFQIPGLASDGICLVISPLISLMKNQIDNLNSRSIKAIALIGGIHSNDIITILDNCEYGNYKFLYLSPERLQSDWILDRIKSLPVNLVAIDEAHCVSQWGHDFRPAYLKISNLKSFFPKTPFLALTATATVAVSDDLVKQLKLEQPKIFKKSFERKNIAFIVVETEDKIHKIAQILTKNPQPSIIYARNRKSCLDISNQLNHLGFNASFYHGGLTLKQKESNMNSWMDEEVQVIVATNAFGMGIDKANVKTVIHIQLPENIENYYQESGRAGRNGEKAYAVLLTNPSDVIVAKNQFVSVLLDKDFLTKVYIKLCNYFQIAFGEGINEQFSFSLNDFCNQYHFPVVKTFNAIQFLDRQGVVSLSQEYYEKILIQFIISSKEVLRYMSLNKNEEEVILTILRSYSGIYENLVAINISFIAKNAGTTEATVLKILQKLQEREIIYYRAKGSDSAIVFNEVRDDERAINRISKYLNDQNTTKKHNLQSVLDYVNDTSTCRNKLILSYFGEISDTDCGICSVCLKKNKNKSNNIDLAKNILNLLMNEKLSSRDIENRLDKPIDEIIATLQNLLENNLIIIEANNKYTHK